MPNKPNKRVLLIDEESAFTRFLQDDLEQREISVACVHSAKDLDGAAAFAPNALVADKRKLAKAAPDLLEQLCASRQKLPTVLMDGVDPVIPRRKDRIVSADESHIVATLPKPFEPHVLARLIERFVDVGQKTIDDADYIKALIASDQLIENIAVEFQSKHSLIDGRVVGYEALSRLKTRRAIDPSTIFSSTTGIDLEISATLNVVEQVMKLVDHLKRSEKKLPVSFNCSAILLTERRLVDALKRLLNSRQNLAGSLIMEITEEDRMADIQTVAEVCKMLAAGGLATSIDDFGTGLSNLDRIVDIPFRELKIDKQIFWSYCNDRVPITVLGSIIDFCRSRGAKSVVEGIETPFHLAKARLLGADYGQGFYWGHAVPPQYLVKAWHGY